MFLYINYPSFIKPEIFPGVKFLRFFRWYGLMYVVAFSLAYFILKKVAKEGALNTPDYKVSEDDIFSFIFTGIVFLLIGARLGSTLIYNPEIYLKKPWMIFWPFENGHFVGFAGMSYHGGFIGGLFGMIFWCLRHKRPVAKWIDAMSLAIPLGYTFGRLGNFLNGELFGRITTMPWGMVFPDANLFPASEPWVQDFAAKIGMNISSPYVNLPRHPSQLYEALFEGVILWLILWMTRKHIKFDGQIGCMYTAGYGIFRFFIEYFRQPDENLGFRLGDKTAMNIYENTSFKNISTGQILCAIMIVGSILMAIILWTISKKKKAENPEDKQSVRKIIEERNKSKKNKKK